MGVPENIRAVPRPRNTVVIDSGSNGAKRYSVHVHFLREKARESISIERA